MATDDVIRMLRSNGAPYPDDLLKKMSNYECWQWMYANKPKKPKAPKQAPQRAVCFTGFTQARKQELMDIADHSGWRVVQTVGPTMSHLCTGEKPGPSKIEKANKMRASILAEVSFIALITSE